MKRYIRGFKNRYFKLSLIAVYSSIDKLSKSDISYIYHKISYKEPNRQTSPPFIFYNIKKV